MKAVNWLLGFSLVYSSSEMLFDPSRQAAWVGALTILAILLRPKEAK